jgi:hypothetical protein
MHLIFGLWAVLMCICVLAQGADHSARLEEIVTRKTTEAKQAHKHAENMVNQAKSRAEVGVKQSLKNTNAASSHKELHDRHINAVPQHSSGDDKGPPTRAHTTLDSHGVSGSLIKEINNMATSFIPREAIVKHVKAHFPNKQPHEWNDIVITAINAAGKDQPDSLDTNKANAQDADFRRLKFQRAKDSMQSTVGV